MLANSKLGAVNAAVQVHRNWSLKTHCLVTNHLDAGWYVAGMKHIWCTESTLLWLGRVMNWTACTPPLIALSMQKSTGYKSWHEHQWKIVCLRYGLPQQTLQMCHAGWTLNEVLSVYHWYLMPMPPFSGHGEPKYNGVVQTTDSAFSFLFKLAFGCKRVRCRHFGWTCHYCAVANKASCICLSIKICAITVWNQPDLLRSFNQQDLIVWICHVRCLVCTIYSR